MQRNSFIDKIIYSVFGFLFLSDYIYILFTETNCNVFVLFTFFVIGAISVTFFVIDQRSYSINKFLLVYFFIFGYLAPLNQYVSGYNAWKLEAYSDYDYLYANICLILFLMIYLFCANVLFRHISQINFSIRDFSVKMGNENEHDNRFVLTNMGMIILSIVDVVSVVVVIKSSGGSNQSSALQSSALVIAMIIFEFIPVSTLMLYILLKSKHCVFTSRVMNWIFIFINFICFIRVFMPTLGIVPRYLLFGTYLTLGMLIFPKLKHKSILLIGFTLGFYYIFPAFNFFKYHTVNDISQFTFGGLNFDFYDYDAHQMFMLAIKFTSGQNFLWGKNIFTALLCFVPRTIWTGKLEPSGALIASSYNASFVNLSCPIYAEFYLAFGLVGLFIGAVVLTFIIRKLETGYLKDNIITKGICIICMGVTIYYLRGAMLPATSYLLGMCISYFIVYVIGKCSSIIKIK